MASSSRNDPLASSSGQAYSPTSTHSREGSVPFPHSYSDDGAGRLSSETASNDPPFEVHTTVEHPNRLHTVVRTIIADRRRARRRSAPESSAPRPRLESDALHNESALDDSSDHGHEYPGSSAGTRGFGIAAAARSAGAPYPSINDRLAGLETQGTGKRVSFDREERPASPPLRNGLGLHSSRGSDPLPAAQVMMDRRPGGVTSPPRTGSPLRRWLRARDARDIFVAKDPYRWGFHVKKDTILRGREFAAHSIDLCLRQLYITLLLRLPSIYFGRVGRLFEEAALTRKEMERIVACMHSPEWEFDLEIGEAGGLSQPLREFKNSWEEFVDHVIKEWKTLNLVSALLLTAILTLFTLDAAAEPVTRTAGLLSLICALMSLVYGCMYIIRFQTMRTMAKAAKWAEAAQASTTSIFWNVWVFLALPTVFLAWALLLFITAILAYTWTTDPPETPYSLSPTAAIASRTVITAVFALGLVFFALVLGTFRSYSEPRSPFASAYSSPRAGSGRLAGEGVGARRPSSEAGARSSEEFKMGERGRPS